MGIQKLLRHLTLHRRGREGQARPMSSAPRPAWEGLQTLETRICLTVVTAPDFYQVDENGSLIADGLAGNPAGVLANDQGGTSQPSGANLATPPLHGVVNLNQNGTFTYEPKDNFHGTDSFEYFALGPIVSGTLINPSTHVWRYLHPLNGVNPANADPDFNTTWYLPQGNPLVPAASFSGTGSGLMAYGQYGTENPTTNIGTPPSGSRYSAYFRTTFEFPSDPDSLTAMTAALSVDDGAFVYLNGTRILTLSMPVGAVDAYTTLGVQQVEQVYNYDLVALIPNLRNLMVQGTNTLAISVHNSLPDSSDLALRFSLAATFGSNPVMATATIQVIDGDLPPVGSPDLYVMNEGGTLAAASVLANDGELIDATSLVDVSSPVGLPAGAVFNLDAQTGVPTLNLAGAPDFSGVITFSYRLMDEDGLSDPVPVAIHVLPINDAPVAVDDPGPGGAYEVVQNTTFNSGGSTASQAMFNLGSQWRYEDTGLDVHATSPDWFRPEFDPNQPNSTSPAWKTGLGPFGFGLVGAASNPLTLNTTLVDADQITYYFRRNFTIAQASSFNAASLDLILDDGAVVYLNGVEILRSNMPAEVTTATTMALTAIDLAAERAINNHQLFLPQGILRDGVNVVAVEVHQPAMLSSDIAFDMGLSLFSVTGVLVNDRDDSAINAVSVISTPQHGNVSMGLLGNFTYTPTPGYAGADSFTYRITDSLGVNSATATVRFNVQPPILLPAPMDDQYGLIRGGILDSAALGRGLLFNDVLPRPITRIDVIEFPNDATFLQAPGLDGHFILEPDDPMFTGQIVFSYQLTDAVGAGPIATVTIDVVPPNLPPIANDDPGAGGAYVTVQSRPLNTTGLISLLPREANWRYLHITNNVDPALVDLDFNATWFSNAGGYNGPAFAGPAPAPFSYGVVNGLIGGTLLDTPPSGSRKTSYFTTTFQFDGDLAAIAALRASVLVDDGVIIYLNGQRVGQWNISAGASDTFDLLSVLQVSEIDFVDVNLTNALVNGTNFLAISVHNLMTDSSDLGFDLSLSALILPGPNVLSNDTDGGSAPLAAILDAPPSHGQVVLQSDGRFIYTPAPNFIGQDAFTYFANDGVQNSDNPATVSLSVTDGNIPSTVVDDSGLHTVYEDSSLDTLARNLPSVYANDGLLDDSGVAYDPILDAIVDAAGTRGTVHYNAATGHFVFISEPGFRGETSFSYRVVDKDGPSEPALVRILVIANPGDINDDGTLNGADIDVIFQHIRAGQAYDPALDVAPDGIIDYGDVIRLVTDPLYLNTALGDVTLDGAVSLGDLMVLADAFNGPGGWAQGDMNGDGQVGIGDLVILAAAFGFRTPDLEIQLAVDGGASGSDGLTNDPTINGQVIRSLPIVSLRAGLDGAPIGSFVDILHLVDEHDQFLLDGAQLALIHGAELADGPHVLRVDVEDAEGGIATRQIMFTLDRTAPTVAMASPSQLPDSVPGADLLFSEPMDPSTLSADAFNLIEAGDDGLFLTPDDVQVEIASVLTLNDATFARLMTQTLPFGKYELRLAADRIADPAGNALGAGDVTFRFNITQGAGRFEISNSRRDFPAAAGMERVEIGDLNGDGHLDMVMTGAKLLVLMADGAGRFRTPVEYALGSSPSRAALGDVDGDGDLDIVASGSGFSNTTIFVLRGNGFGQFTAPTSLTVGLRPEFVTLGDLDKDGDLDIVTANGAAASLTILRGNGSGGFGSRVDHAVSATPASAAIGDVDRDGDLDIVTAHANGSDDGINVLLADGLGGFGNRTALLPGLHPHWVTLGDLNGDQDLDIIACESIPGLMVMLGSSGAGFGTANRFSEASHYYSARISDLDEDGRMDIVAANSDANKIEYFRGNGSGGLDAPVQFSSGLFPKGLAVGDLNSDGDRDVAVVNSDSGTVSVLMGDGMWNPSFGAETPVGPWPGDMALGDMDEDGFLDMAVTSRLGNFLTVMRGDGAGGFGSRIDYPTGGAPGGVRMGDVNGDGHVDIVYSAAGKVSVLPGNGSGGFAAKVDHSLALFLAGLADVDGDGDLDVLGISNDNIAVALGNGAGGFSPKTDYPVDLDPVAVEVGDVDGDGDMDIISASYHYNEDLRGSTITVLRGDGAGSFGARMDHLAGADTSALAIGDVDEDGDLDVVTADNNYGGSFQVWLVRGNGSGGFGPRVAFTAGVRPEDVKLGDIDGDGHLDIISSDENGNSVSILLGNGAGAFSARVQFGVGNGPIALRLGDLDGDGDLDIVTANFDNNSVTTLIVVRLRRFSLA